MEVLLASPRGFCAGVDRAIEVVEAALDVYGPPVYVRHEIVHNRHVVESLRTLGARFVEDLADVPEGSVLVFSAHGVSPAIRAEAAVRGLRTIDATCPLVTKVHLEALRFAKHGFTIVLIGHEGHAEVEGTMGEAPQAIHLVENVEDVEHLEVPDPHKVAYLTQTTLSVDETTEIIAALRKRFPGIQGPPREDICYATQNRQTAVKALARTSDLVLVVGSPNSSNSERLREVAAGFGIPSFLVDSAEDIRPEWLEGKSRIGVTAGASAPENLVAEIVEFLRKRAGGVEVEQLQVVEEEVTFPLPAELVREAGKRSGR
jgi:4-hydroxy-3-methylbut-2-enyl diphosphate reductase